MVYIKWNFGSVFLNFVSTYICWTLHFYSRHRKRILKIFPIKFFCNFSCYLPWLLIIINSYAEIEKSLAWHQDYNDNYNFLILSLFQILGMTRSFVSMEDVYKWFLVDEAKSFSTIIYLIMSIIVIISLVYATKRRTQSNLIFILSSILVSFVFFLL